MRCLRRKLRFQNTNILYIMSARLLIKPEEPHPAKATLCLPSRRAGRGWGWGAMTVEIITNYMDIILYVNTLGLRVIGVDNWDFKTR